MKSSRRSPCMIVRLVLIAVILNISYGQGGDAKTKWKDKLFQSFEWLYGPGQKCRYRTDLSKHVNETLRSHISGQNEGIDYIVNAVSVWESQKKMNATEPLVLAITGPTGVGKTETAYRLSEALFADSRPVSNEFGITSYEPCGLLALRGEDYSSSSELAQGGVHEVHRLLKTRIVEHLIENNGNAMILFDEVQKLMPGVLELFMPALEERGHISSTIYRNPTDSYTEYTAKVLHSSVQSLSQWLYRDHPAEQADWEAEEYTDEEENNQSDTCSDHSCEQKSKPTSSSSNKYYGRMQTVTKTYPTDRVVFVFVSDIGVEKMTKQLIIYDNRNELNMDSINNDVKTALDEQFTRLKLGKVINTVIPFLPMEREQIEDVLRLKIMHLSNQFKHYQWLVLHVDEEVLQYLSSTPFIMYKNHTIAYKPSASRRNAEEYSKAVDTLESVDKQIITKSKRFATYGARGIKSGPLPKLQSIIYRYMQPWKPDRILHVGLITPRNVHLSQEQWGNENMQDIQVYLQWCKPDISMLTSSYAESIPPQSYPVPPSNKKSAKDAVFVNKQLQFTMLLQDLMSSHSDSIAFSEEITFSDMCETKWFGKVTK